MQIRKRTLKDYEAVYGLWLSCKGMGLNTVDDSRDGSVGLYDNMLVTVSYPCSKIDLWDMNTLEKRKEINTTLSLSGNAFIEENKLYIISRNIYGVGIIYLN